MLHEKALKADISLVALLDVTLIEYLQVLTYRGGGYRRWMGEIVGG